MPLHSAGLEVMLHSELLTEPYQGSIWERGHAGTLLVWRKVGLQFCEKNPDCIQLLVLDAA